MERTIYIRSNPIRVVVKPHPGDMGINKLDMGNINGARGYANALNLRFGWPIVDEA